MRAHIRSLAGAILFANLVLAGWIMMGQGPLLPGLGLALTAAAPLAFMIRSWNQIGRGDDHPVAISALSGLGCVMIMVAVQRFGEEHQWVLISGLAALGAWMAWQRWVWRSPRSLDPND